MHSYPVYYEQPYLTSLEATVVSITDKGVILDRTICYPEGGGQSGDRGTIGGCVLLDTTKDDEHTIYHHVENPTFQAGEQVLIGLDWNYRYRFMQMHTAQHMASGLLFSHFGIQTVSVHQGQSILTIETDAQQISLSQCHELEDLVNEQVLASHAVHYEVHTQASAQELGLRRSIKVEGDGVRVVVVEDVDTIACGGLHVANTREIGLFHYAGQEKIRSHIRLIFTVGETARQMIRAAEEVAAGLGTLFSAPLGELVTVATQAVEQAASDKRELQKAEERIAALELDKRVQKAAVKDGVPVVVWDVDADLSLKDIGLAVLSHPDLALCAAKQDGQRVLWLIGLQGRAADLIDFPHAKQALLATINAKGGGRPPLYQGAGSGEASALFAAFGELLS